jgi:hypothetical protein
MLFHGTSNTEPSKIYDDEFGFDMRHSSNGMWGPGIYFAVNASYSKDKYAYKNRTTSTRTIFMARVALGDVVELKNDPTIKLPPEKPLSQGKKFAVQRYDSIKGNTGGTDIYIIYENTRAYPEYLITFNNE